MKDTRTLCDLDNDAPADTTTVEIAGRLYRLDLCVDHYRDLEEVVAKLGVYLDKAKPVRKKRPSPAPVPEAPTLDD